jgi:hypothetical protein
LARPWNLTWTASRCHAFGLWLNGLLEMQSRPPHVVKGTDPEGRPALVATWCLFDRQVELYLAETGEASVVRREGAPAYLPLADARHLLGPLREAIAWMERRRPCYPATE